MNEKPSSETETLPRPVGTGKRRRTAAVLTAAACIALAVVFFAVILPELKFRRAEALIASGDYKAAYLLLRGTDRKNSRELRESILPQYMKAVLSEAEVGSYVSFGSYEQDNNTSNGSEEIEWLILAKEGGRALVVSRYALDCQKYHTTRSNVTWEACALRKWLNETFLNAAFSEAERTMIPAVTVSTEINPYYGTNSGADTTDRVFLLSIGEADRYFRSDGGRQCAGTAYCHAQGAFKADNGNCWWWLRSLGVNSFNGASVAYSGFIDANGIYVNEFSYAVRPALWIDTGD
ncbi:MAG: hypothetical protein IK064_01470 [Clostridia bacterium]|nr:hypothetical protein [Clostridia bacterium]